MIGMKLSPFLFLLALVPANAETPLPPADVVCNEKWCMISKDTLRSLLENTQKLSEHVAELRWMCGWKDGQ